MTETQIRYFMKAFETGNITSASEDLMVTRAAVSKVIISLENDLSHQLFKRRPYRFFIRRVRSYRLKAVFNAEFIRNSRNQFSYYV